MEVVQVQPVVNTSNKISMLEVVLIRLLKAMGHEEAAPIIPNKFSQGAPTVTKVSTIRLLSHSIGLPHQATRSR